MALSAEDIQQVKDLMAATLGQAPAPAAADPAQVPPQAAPNQAPSVEVFKQMMEEVLNKKMQTQESNVAETIWNERLTTLKTSNPALGEYLEAADEFGTPRMERINAAGDFGKRMESLSTLATNFNAAQVAGTQGQSAPAVPKKIQEQADRTSKAYTDLDDNLAKGEISPSDHTNAFFDTLESEVLDQMSH